MKRFLKLLAITLCFIFVLTACKSTPNNTNSDDENQYLAGVFDDNDGEYNPESPNNDNNSTVGSNKNNSSKDKNNSSNNSSKNNNKNNNSGNKDNTKGPNKNQNNYNAYEDKGSGNGSSGSSSSNNVNIDNFTPVLRFAVAGDVHTRNSDADYLSHDRLAAVYNTAYDYAENHKKYKKLDGIFFTGDNSQSGTAEQQTYFFNYLKQNTKSGTTARAVMGNHEYYQTKNYSTEGAEQFKRYSGYDSEDTHIKIGGYHFIFISLDQYKNKGSNAFFSNTKLDWLKNELDKAVKDAPNQQIFIFSHIPPYDTLLYSATSDGDKNLKTLLNNYPQAVIFAGHTHASMSDPRSVWQGKFTALNTGSMAYLSLGIPGTSNPEGGYRALDNEGACVVDSGEETIRNGNMYYIVEINDDGIVKISIYDIFTKSVYGEPIILDSVNPKYFKYTTARKNDNVKPTFKANASLKALATHSKSVIVDIPLASCKYEVQGYRIDVYKQNIYVKTCYRLHGYGDTSTKKVRAYISALQPSTNYTINVYAISSYGYKSDPLTLDVTTGAAGSTISADILDVQFNLDGTATNLASGEKLVKEGSASISKDNKLGLNVATFDGNDSYSFMQLHNWYDEIGNGFTFETYAYISKKPNSGYVDILSAQEGGGFGFEYKSDSCLYFYLHVGGGYKLPSTRIEVGEWVHLVGVYDGSSVKLYVNGSLAALVAASGNFKAQSASAQYLAIGADSAPISPAHHFTGKIAIAKIYSDPLNATQITNLYNKLK